MRVFITGGAGFIGCNLADEHLRQGHDVLIFDNLSRRGSERNLAWLRQRHGERLDFARGDVRDFAALRAALPPDTARAYHLAGQVAVTTSVEDPREDFTINALGTFNVLEAVRERAPGAVLLYASTNKVYGGMEDLAIVEGPTRYSYRDLPRGVSESQPLDFHSPYGCSKGAGDQYVRDYHRIYGLSTVVFRQSAIYGPRQFGVEDQGWAAHFVIAAQTGRPISIYGDGKQVRDMLYVDDLIDLYELALEKIDIAKGKIYNVGGGPDNTLSIWAEFAPMISSFAGRTIEPARYGPWRPGDQPVCILDISKAEAELGWRPKVGVEEGMRRLWDWVAANIELFQS